MLLYSAKLSQTNLWKILFYALLCNSLVYILLQIKKPRTTNIVFWDYALLYYNHFLILKPLEIFLFQNIIMHHVKSVCKGKRKRMQEKNRKIGKNACMFAHLLKNDTSAHFIGFMWGLHEWTFLKCLEQCLAPSKLCKFV